MLSRSEICNVTSEPSKSTTVEPKASFAPLGSPLKVIAPSRSGLSPVVEFGAVSKLFWSKSSVTSATLKPKATTVSSSVLTIVASSLSVGLSLTGLIVASTLTL